MFGIFKTKNNNENKFEMMSIEDLKKSNINIEIVKEALTQAEKLLKDFLENNNVINQKLFILFGRFLTILMILIPVIFIILFDKNYENYKYLLYLLIPLGWHFFMSLIFFLFAFRSVNFGTIGTLPHFWLQKNTIDSDEKELARRLAYNTHSYQEAILVTHKNHESKIVLQHSGLYTILIGLIISTIICFFCHSCPFSLFVTVVSCFLLSLLSAFVSYQIAKKA